jgi:selT/selW/selH-like putative selenoprotein
LAAEIKQHRGVDSTLTLGSGGEFEVSVDDRLVFSKRKEHRFPELDEILSQLPAA